MQKRNRYFTIINVGDAVIPLHNILIMGGGHMSIQLHLSQCTAGQVKEDCNLSRDHEIGGYSVQSFELVLIMIFSKNGISSDGNCLIALYTSKLL